mmetsp:Transcript_117035/g.331218  ORF Transcript_117035/g.331218 Transcript_117035/m.331218 type:complete len:205 (-) Transcript_117035:369-983(-)
MFAPSASFVLELHGKDLHAVVEVVLGTLVFGEQLILLPGRPLGVIQLLPQGAVFAAADLRSQPPGLLLAFDELILQKVLVLPLVLRLLQKPVFRLQARTNVCMCMQDHLRAAGLVDDPVEKFRQTAAIATRKAVSCDVGVDVTSNRCAITCRLRSHFRSLLDGLAEFLYECFEMVHPDLQASLEEPHALLQLSGLLATVRELNF